MSEHRDIGFDEVKAGQRVRLTRKSGAVVEGVVTIGSGPTSCIIYLNNDFGSVQDNIASITLLDDVQPALVEGQLGQIAASRQWVEWVDGRWQYCSGQPTLIDGVTPLQRKVVPLSARVAGEGQVVVAAEDDYAEVYRSWAKMVRERSGWHGIANLLDAVAAACDLRDGTQSP